MELIWILSRIQNFEFTCHVIANCLAFIGGTRSAECRFMVR